LFDHVIEALKGTAHDAANPWRSMCGPKFRLRPRGSYGKDGGARQPNTYANQICKPIVLTGMAR
jgi:hypothetical protein